MRMTWRAGASIPILLTIPALLFSQPAPWPMRGRDARHTGRSIEVGPAAPVLLWSYIVGSVGRKEDVSPPTVGSDGAVHIFSWTNVLYCIRPDGPLAWSYRMPTGGYPGAPALGADGRVFTGTSDYRIYSLTPGGSLS
jgi:outer membrane protein assembly factor BamB